MGSHGLGWGIGSAEEEECDMGTEGHHIQKGVQAHPPSLYLLCFQSSLTDLPARVWFLLQPVLNPLAKLVSPKYK